MKTTEFKKGNFKKEYWVKQLSVVEKEIEEITEAFNSDSEEWMVGSNKNHYGFSKAVSFLYDELNRIENEISKLDD